MVIMMPSRKKCPLCRSHLKLRQINLTQAIYFCEHLDCTYPVGETNVVVVERRLKKIGRRVRPTPNDPPRVFNNSPTNGATVPTNQQVQPQAPHLDEDWISGFLESSIENNSSGSGSNNSQQPEVDFSNYLDILNIL